MSEENSTGYLDSVVIISGRVDIRSSLRESLKESGAKKSTLFAAFDEFEDYLANCEEIPTWVFLTLDHVNGRSWLQFLSAKLLNPQLTNCRVTLVLNQNEKEFLGLGYELGCTTHLFMPFTQTGVMNHISAAVDAIEASNGNGAEVSAHFFREHLMEEQSNEELIQLEQGLVDSFPAKPEYMVKLAEAYIANEKQEEATNIIKRARLLGGDVGKSAQQLSDLLSMEMESQEDAAASPDFAGLMNIKKALIVDSDTSAATQLEEFLGEIGVETVVVCENGQQADEHLDGENPPEIILSEWVLPQVSGLQLCQRIFVKFPDPPMFFITSSRLKDNDKVLVNELPITGVLEKPVRKDELQSILLSQIIKTQYPKKSDEIFQKMSRASSAEDFDQVKKLYSSYLSIEQRHPILDHLAKAEYSFATGELEVAKTEAFQAFAKSKGSLKANALMVKILMKMNQKEEALKALQWAQSVSPSNIDRICHLAELCSEIGDAGDAEHFVEKANQVDANAPIAKETEARVALNGGDTSKVKNLMATMGSLAPLITYMNNRAVLLVKEGEIDKGIKLYKDALASLPDDRQTEKAAISYNLGLAFAKLHRLEESQSQLQEIKEDDHPKLFSKVSNLLKNVEKAHKKGVQLNFSRNDEVSSVGVSLHIPKAATPEVGKYGLHMIYSSGKIDDPKVQKKFEGFKELTVEVAKKSA